MRTDDRLVPASDRTGVLDSVGTCLSDSDLVGVDYFSGNMACVTMLSIFQKCLEEANISLSHTHLKSACGECVALIHKAQLNLGAKGEDFKELNTTQQRYQKGELKLAYFLLLCLCGGVKKYGFILS